MGTSTNLPAARTRVLIVDDEPEVFEYLSTSLTCQGFDVESAENGDEALELLSDSSRVFDAAILDLMMPQRDGLETIGEIRRLQPELPVIILSATTSPTRAAQAIKLGAREFLSKPVSDDLLISTLMSVIEPGGPALPVPRAHGAAVYPFSAPAHADIQKCLVQIARANVPVLLLGETGVGKEVLARQLHSLSPRAHKPFVKVNCAALPSELIESELFGYERGAFTGAFKDKPGKFELADGGTILLDEMGDLDVKLQAKLLQVLQDFEFERLGGRRTVKVDVRIIAATHQNLEVAVAEHRFREDLYYRLNIVKLTLPPLRECREDILRIANFILARNSPPGTPLPPLSPRLQQALVEHDWPGNIRELENLMRRYLVLGDASKIIEELSCRRNVPGQTKAPGDSAPAEAQAAPADSAPGDVWRKMRQTETEAITVALHATNWNRKAAAKLLHLDYKPFLYKMKKLGIGRAPATL